MDRMEDEVSIADFLPSPLSTDEAADEPRERLWAVLPQFGYGPDTGPMGGGKFTHRNIDGHGTSLDLNGSYSLKHHQSYGFSVGSPHLAQNRVLLLLRLQYSLDPKREFFGLGNNDVGPDPASVHAIEDIAGAVTVGWRPFKRIAFNFAIGARSVEIWREKDFGNVPYTEDSFPELPGIQGGLVNYLGLSIVWNNRDSVVRPTRGWRLIGKAIHTNAVLLSDFQFTRLVVDAGYLRSLFEDRLVFGVRLNGEWVTGPERRIPFWGLSELGGRDTLRGFYPHRFVGKGRFLANGEVRGRITSFDFFDLWHVQIDGVLFGDGGRVYIDRDQLKDEFTLDTEILSRLITGLQYSYGAGLRIALSESLVARIDAGFSEEETGLVYLSFGQTF